MTVLKLASVLGAMMLAVLVIAPAHAITITNGDAVDHELMIEEGGDEMVSRTVTLPAGETLELCEDGCTIELANGTQESFEGTETVELRDGGFVLTE